MRDSGANTKLQMKIVEFCKHIAGPYEIFAICQSDDYTFEEPGTKSTLEVLLLLQDFQPRLMSYVRVINDRNIIFFAVDRWVFERDVDRGLLGEALARLLLFPYKALIEDDYFCQQEAALKKRLILELLENLILGFPELSYNFHIKPEFFMYEALLNRIRIFPPMAYGTSHFLCGEVTEDKSASVLNGWKAALQVLEKEGVVSFRNGYVILSSTFIKTSNNPKTRFVNTIKKAPRALFASFLEAFPQLLNFLSQNTDAFLKFQTPFWKRDTNSLGRFIDPKTFVLVHTSRGFVSLADKVDIRTYVKQFLNSNNYNNIKVEQFGGVLNDVYLIKAATNHDEKKILVKRFKNLHSMKWFPLSIWSLGARSFALLGKSRLERECSINEVLREAGFSVPRILHVSTSERLVFMEFLEGKNLSYNIKRIASSRLDSPSTAKDLALITEVGKTYAKIHALNVVLGDTKPENILVDSRGNLYLLDFEQASRTGEKSWDIACFLYYSGHYLPLDGEKRASAIAIAFIEGYLRSGGRAADVKCAAIVRYTRVFSIFTLPGVLRTMANECKNIEGPKCKK